MVEKSVLIFIDSACIIFGLIALILVVIRFIRGKKTALKKEVSSFSESSKLSHSLSAAYEFLGDDTRLVSIGSKPLLTLTSPLGKDLKFDDLLQAPAELLGKGRNGSMYRITLVCGTNLVVKRLKECSMSADKFTARMQKIDQVKHPNVLPQVALYCSDQEKLLVYEFQHNGSLHKLLHGRSEGESFSWGKRLNVAITLANTLACMHANLLDEGISHGNIKSSNVLFDEKMEPCLTEYGLRNQDQKGTWKMDVYQFGVLLLELLTGEPVQAANGLDLANWVNSVVREEWTAEVFEKELIVSGANEERMVYLLQVAMKCTNPSPLGRPGMNQVVSMIDNIKEDEDKSFASRSYSAAGMHNV